MTEEMIRRYLGGELNPAEQEEAEQWIATHAEAWLAAYLAEKMEQAPAGIPPQARQEMFARVMAAVKKQASEPIPPVAPVRRMTGRWLSWAAAACFLIVIGFTWWRLPDDRAPKQVAAIWRTIRNDSVGSLKKLILPDSTVVMLNGQSFISFSDSYNITDRQVQLTGEAFFEVVHSDSKPFVVQAGHVSTRVYGTAFNIQAYPGYSQLRVALKRGKIGVSYQGKEEILTPGQLLVYHNTTGYTSMEQPDADEIGDWMTGRLSFYKTSVEDALRRIESKYGVHFSYSSGLLKDKTLTASFDRAGIQKIIQHLSFVLDLQFMQKGDTIYVK